MWKLTTEEKGKELRAVFADTLISLMDENDKIFAMDADLAGASGFKKIQKAHPDQFLNVGISEANMMGLAAGMSMRGIVPFVHTFAPFVARRSLDQIFLSGAYAGNTINIYGSDPGVCVAANGGTHTTFEDVAVMRTIPKAMVFDPADQVQLAWLIRELARLTGVHYIRANRKDAVPIYAEGSAFTIGKGNIIKEGRDVLLISMGEVLHDALNAARELEDEGISVEVADMFTVKPLDEELIRKEAAGKKLVVTFENHSIIGGLGGAVAEVMAEAGLGVPLKRVGVQDRFGQVGTLAYLKEAFGLTKAHVKEVIQKAL